MSDKSKNQKCLAIILMVTLFLFDLSIIIAVNILFYVSVFNYDLIKENNIYVLLIVCSTLLLMFLIISVSIIKLIIKIYNTDKIFNALKDK